MMTDAFATPVFFICFRESLETSIIVSVLLSFLKQTLASDNDRLTHKRLVKQVWVGVALGCTICILIGVGVIGAFYGLGTNPFGSAEYVWEGVFGLIASIVISLMGAALLRISKLQDKWRVEIAKALEASDNKHSSAGGRFKTWCEKYAMFLLPFITVLREGIEAVLFVGGVGLTLPASSFPLAVVCGLGAGALVGYLMYRGGNAASLQIFLIISMCFLYLVAAGLFSKAVWFFEMDQWNKVIGGDAAETGFGPGSYDIRQSVWHVNCCSPEIDGGGGWGVFNSLFGWQNSATYGSVISYNLYWLVIIVCFATMGYAEKRGHLPFLAGKTRTGGDVQRNSPSDDNIVESKGQLSSRVEEARRES